MSLSTLYVVKDRVRLRWAQAGVGLFTAAAAVAVPAGMATASGPAVGLSPTSGPAGTSVTVSVSGLKPRTTAAVSLASVSLGKIGIGGSGRGSATVVVPGAAPVGRDTLSVLDGSILISAPFAVTSSATSSTATTSTTTSTTATTTSSSTASPVAAGISPGAAFEHKFETMTSTQQAQVISAMSSAGVHWLRVDVPSDFRFDNIISQAQAHGIKVDAILQSWGTAPSASAMGSFATQAVSVLHPLGVETYEVLNEPNCLEYCLAASAYAAILQSSYASIKAADPTAFVLTAGLGPNSSANEPYNYLSAMYGAGAAGHFDAFNIHPYSYPDTPLQTGDSWNPWSYLPQLHQIMVNHGDGNKSIWLTEFGCPTGTDGGYAAACTDASLATQITDAYAAARQYSWTGPLFVYDWQDDAVTGDGDFGLYHADGSPKSQSLAAFSAAAAG